MIRVKPPKVGTLGQYTRYVVRWQNSASLYREEYFTDKDNAEHFYNILVMNDYDVELICEEVKTTIKKQYFLNLLKKEDKKNEF